MQPEGRGTAVPVSVVDVQEAIIRAHHEEWARVVRLPSEVHLSSPLDYSSALDNLKLRCRRTVGPPSSKASGGQASRGSGRGQKGDPRPGKQYSAIKPQPRSAPIVRRSPRVALSFAQVPRASIPLPLWRPTVSRHKLNRRSKISQPS
jgi:hypothetical protein